MQAGDNGHFFQEKQPKVYAINQQHISTNSRYIYIYIYIPVLIQLNQGPVQCEMLINLCKRKDEHLKHHFSTLKPTSNIPNWSSWRYLLNSKLAPHLGVQKHERRLEKCKRNLVEDQYIYISLVKHEGFVHIALG